MSTDKELESWQSEWQALGGREGLSADLARRVVQDGRRLRRGVAVELGAAAVSVAISAALVVRTHFDPVTMVACTGILVFTAVWITRLFSVREGSLRTAAQGLDDFVALTRRRVLDDLRWNRFALRATQVLALLLVPWSVWAFVARYAMYRAEPWRAVVGFGTAAVILAGSYLWMRRKRRALEAARDRFEAVVADGTLS